MSDRTRSSRRTHPAPPLKVNRAAFLREDPGSPGSPTTGKGRAVVRPTGAVESACATLDTLRSLAGAVSNRLHALNARLFLRDNAVGVASREEQESSASFPRINSSLNDLVDQLTDIETQLSELEAAL